MFSCACHAETTTTPDVAQRRIGADLAQHLDPAEPRQHHVEEHEVRRRLTQAVERRLAVGDLLAAKRVAERHDEQLAQRRLVVDDEHAWTVVT